VTDRDPRLASEPELQPSSGFVASVMDAVREAATEPPPLPFPWRRFVAGIVLCLVACGATMYALQQPEFYSVVDLPALTSAAPGVLYAAASLLLAIVVMRLTRSRSS